MSALITKDDAFTSFLDLPAGSVLSPSSGSERDFILQDSGWNVPVYCLVRSRHTHSQALQPQLQCKATIFRDATGLRTFLEDNASKDTVQCFILRQETSWGRFEISKNGLQEILGQDQSYSPFLDLTALFGVKCRSRGDDSTIFHFRDFGTDCPKPHELCYNVRYMYRHGRKDEYPWSVRQTAVYYTKGNNDFSSRWIFIQPPSTVESSFATIFDVSNLEKSSDLMTQPLFIHLLLLVGVESSWRQYLTEIEGEIEALSDKALYSRVGRSSKYDYQITFIETQQIERIRQRLYKKQTMLRMTVKTLKALQNLFNGKKENYHNSQRLLDDELQGLMFRYESHCASIDRLLKVADGTMTLLMKILDFRNDELNCLNVSKTRELLVAAEQESLVLNGIAKQTQQDSRSMKIVTLIALVYMPGTLVASIYSSNIVQVDTKNDELAPRRQLISFLIITGFLTLVTISVAFIWNRRASGAKRSQNSRSVTSITP